MNISFSSTAVLQNCNTEKAMFSAYGKACANLLKMRLHQLLAAEYLGIFSPSGSTPLRCESYTKNNVKSFQLPLKDSYILIFEAIDGDMLGDKNDLDWNTIKTIIIHNIKKITHN